MRRHLIISSAILFIAASARAERVAVQSAMDPMAAFGDVQASHTAPLTLSQAYEIALKQSESLKNRKEAIIQSEALGRASAAGAYPHLSWILTDFIQDTSGVSGSTQGVTSTALRKERAESKFQLEQPLFSGLREYSITSSYKRETARDKALYQRAMLQLYQDVAQAFYSVVQAEADLGNTRTSIKLSQERVGDLRDRSKLGKSRDSEVVTAESQLALDRAQEAAFTGQVVTVRETLSLLLGVDVSATPLSTDLNVPVPVPPLEESLQNASRRSDIAAQQEEVEAKKFRARYYKGSYWPSIDMLGNYYTHRIGYQEDIDWDLLFTLEVPIYQGGEVSANVRAAASEYRQAQTNLDFLRRQTASETKQVHASLVSTMEQARTLGEAYNKARRAYELLSKEYRYGLVNNLEVIAAMNTMQMSKKSWDDALVQTKYDYVRLLVATETVNAATNP